MIDAVFGLFLEVGTRAEGPVADSGEHHYPDLVIPGNVLERLVQLPQRRKVQAIEHVGAIEGDRGAVPVLPVEDIPKTERIGRLRLRKFDRHGRDSNPVGTATDVRIPKNPCLVRFNSTRM